MAIDQLMQRFAAFVHAQPKMAAPQAGDPPAPSYPPDVARIREICAHHMTPLLLLSRADGDKSAVEQATIVDHCMSVLKRAGITAGPAERETLASLATESHPTLMQLDPALKKVAAEGADSAHRLMAAAILVLEADGKRDPNEVDVLNALSEELARLKG